MNPVRISVLALAVAALAAPGASQSAGKDKLPKLYIDVATHDMAGMPGGGLGRMAMGMFGKGEVRYGMTRAPGMPGYYMDIALHTGANPAPEASQAIPSGLRLGKSLPLLPPPPERSTSGNDGGMGQGIADGNASSRILIYWGCGTEVRKGQPREIRISVRNGKADVSGSMPQGRSSPVKAITPGREYALWPNERSHKPVPDRASLVGEHQVSGPGVPESMRFAIEQAHDFMPKIDLSSSGGGASATRLAWKPVDRATGYFLNAMGQRDDAIVMWSSAEMAEPGSGLMDDLPEATVAKWIKEKVLLSPQVSDCAIPAGIFGEGAGLTQMIAYGPERQMTWPPKPAKAPASWQPEWALRVRTKSTTMLPGGLSAGGGQEQQAPAEKVNPAKLLKGLFGR